MDNASPSLADIAAVCKDENGFGGSWLWIIVLFLFMWGNGGWGNRENMATSADVQRATDFAALERQNNETVAAVRQAAYDNMAFTKDGNYNTLSELRDIQSSIAANAANQQNCCCTTQRAIDGVNFNAANYSAAIQANDTANTQKVLDAICNMRSEWKESKIAEQGARIQALETQQFIGAATANLVHNPIPAYSVQPPFFNQPIYGTTF